MICRLTIASSAPRTKKTSNRIIRIPGKNGSKGFTKVLPSKAFCDWQDAALKEVIQTKFTLMRRGVHLPITCGVQIRALVFREAAIGDAVGFYQAIGDFLQEAGILANDRQIVHFDGSRLLKDALRPRVEIEIFQVEPEQASLLPAGYVAEEKW
jgi:hypothetical protein